ncbi:MAG: stage 0 sporulation family protein [Candidatus Omnitrophica bacterium]|nr:stage 0 sporulation family protein [Candidatus Omnitrophota bacterium]MCG2703237.1 stage 0 sporulation family protein [Candidatus Omnitrophota bacterium]
MKIVDVKLRDQGKPVIYNVNNVEVKPPDMVILESERGIDFGQIVSESEHATADASLGGLKRILRVATAQDIEQIARNKREIKDVFDTAQKKIEERALSMKLVEAEYSFDRSKIIFYFTAEGRIDFRELVRDLAHLFKARIELKQIGVRDEVKMFGGYGCCGRQLCCSAFLKDFEPVTIRMAKRQNMPLNPEKISGLCGRLMCCLGYEYQTYKDFSKNLPKEGQYIETKEGKGRVISVHTLKQTVVIEMEDERVVEISFKDRPLEKEKGENKDKGKREDKDKEGNEEKE